MPDLAPTPCQATPVTALSRAHPKQRAKVVLHGSDGKLLSELGPSGRVTRDYYHLNGSKRSPDGIK